jgi:cell division transport system ATP-binding protein
LLDHLSVFDNVAVPLRIAGQPEDDVRRYVAELLTWVGLKDHLTAPAPSLSGGQQQLAAIARAVIGRPRLILADEPTGNVDESMENRLMNLFQELNRLGATVVIATHSRRLARSHGHRRFRVEGGRLWEDGGPGSSRTTPGSQTGAEAPAVDSGGTV